MADEVVSSTDQFGNPIFQVQADWQSTNPKLASYIKNKPAIPAQVQADFNVTDNRSPAYIKNKVGGGGVPQVNSDWNAASGVAQILNKPSFVPTNSGFASSASLSLLTNGTDQTAALNSAFLNSNYTGIVMDNSPGADVTINGAVNGQGKVLRFLPGNTIKGSGSISNFILDTGLRQKCFDIGSSGVPSLTINPIGTSLSVISPWVFGANDNGGDVARQFQATIDCCIRNGAKISKIYVPTGTYVLGSPLNLFNWNSGGSSYVFFLLTIEGENTFSSADGYGTVLNFGSRKNSFGIGIHQGKGVAIKNIKLIGGFNYSFPGAYTFYNSDFNTMTDGASRDTGFSPNSAIAIDPYGPSVPADGGWPGNDAYGVALSTYYRGNTNGSTGVELEDIFISKWVVGVITSPNGLTVNAELVSIYKVQVQNIKLGFVSCQSQEKLNVVRHIESWGVCGCLFASNLGYGASAPGSWWVEDVNIAGFSHTFINNIQSGYFPSFFSNIYAESLGRFGVLESNNGTVVQNATINFAYYNNGGAFAYLPAQISGQGVTFIGCGFRQYGTGLPVVINAINGPVFFRDCAFEAVPIFNQDYALGYCGFENCVVSNTGETLNPMGIQTIATGSFTNTFPYGYGKIRVGNTFSQTRRYNLNGSVPAARLPVNTAGANYVVTVTVSGGYNQSVITCSSDELNRVFVNDVIVCDAAGGGVGLTILGIVTAAGGGTFTVKYLPGTIVSGNHYYLYVWLPFLNISFVGDTTSGSANITNVTIVDGSLTSFVGAGGYLLTSAYKTSGGFTPNLIRAVTWNGVSTLTVDKNSTVTATKLLFTNTDATLDPGTPTIAAGSGAGTSPTVSITKGNDRFMQVSVLTGTLPLLSAVIATVSFSFPFAGGYIPSVSFSPANGSAATLSGVNMVFMDAIVSSSFTITSGTTALTAATTYLWNIECN